MTDALPMITRPAPVHAGARRRASSPASAARPRTPTTPTATTGASTSSAAAAASTGSCATAPDDRPAATGRTSTRAARARPRSRTPTGRTRGTRARTPTGATAATRRTTSDAAARALLAAAVAALVVGAVILAPASEGDSSYEVDVVFDDSRGLLVGQLVQIAGARVGKITDVSVTRDYKARVHMEVDRALRAVPRGRARARSSRPGLIAENYVQCDPGTPDAPPLEGKRRHARRPCRSRTRPSRSASPTSSRRGTRRRSSGSASCSRRSGSRPPGAARTSTRSCGA